MAPKILKNTLFIVNCSDCLSAEFVGHASTPYNKIGRHLDLIYVPKLIVSLLFVSVCLLSMQTHFGERKIYTASRGL